MPEIVNVDQAAAWDGPSGDGWVGREAAQNEALRPHSERLLEVAAVGTTDHVLDVGCGTRRDHPGGARGWPSTVTSLGVDLSTVMLARARERAAADGPDERRVPAGRRPGAPVRGRVGRPGREPLRRDVLRRSRGGVRQHRPGDVSTVGGSQWWCGRTSPATTGCACRGPRSRWAGRWRPPLPAPPACSASPTPIGCAACSRRPASAASCSTDLAVPFRFGGDLDAAVAMARENRRDAPRCSTTSMPTPSPGQSTRSRIRARPRTRRPTAWSSIPGRGS